MARVDGHRAGCVCWQCDRAGEELAKHTAEIERLRIERDDAIRRGGEWARKATEEAECNKPLRAEIERLTGQLAECYRLTGADPDGNEDWRLAPQAVVEVKRLREQTDAEIERLQRENANEFKRSDEIKVFLGPLCGLALTEDPARIATWTWWQGVKRSFEILEAKLAAAEAALDAVTLPCAGYTEKENADVRQALAAKTEVRA